MFEDSLMESAGQIRTRSRRYAAGSFALQAALLGGLALIPYLYPAALPRQSLSMLLTAPPPPVAPAPVQHTVSSAAPPVRIDNAFTAPRLIPAHIAAEAPGPSLPGSIGLDEASHTTSPLSSLFGTGAPAAAPPHVVAPQPHGPIHISSGVAAGQLLAPIRPVYPAIALAARAQGTVILAATISKSGAIENLHVVSGPPLLRQAALDAVSRARYAPYRLNGEPVEVETSVQVVFTLGN
ncbi:energy transducer TonB [Paracidobacterium acidisoli]|uniref:Energy transducer TonB n=1 Tax=Paracidobacterium acidisoli TaxID=2303751 RepID=A0A372ITV9_9BACT|nr:energy transducer TonB [Paracidobacterium acidisoli]MBT9329643.1 energy transducer TonB [Paracidobacterium acidisoli]